MDYNYEKIVPPQIDSPEIPTRGVGASPSTNELLKKKLEAELRAAEAIGKLKQSIIEKRLAFELAAIEAEHKRRKLGLPVYPTPFFGQSSRQQEYPTAFPTTFDNKNLFKRGSLWPKKLSTHRLVPQRGSHHHDSFHKSSQHDTHKGEAAYRDTLRPGTKESHKHMRSAMKQGVPVYGIKEPRLRRDGSYVHQSRSMEDDDSLQEVGNEEEEEVAVADPTQSVVNASPVDQQIQPPTNKFKQFFSKLRKNPAANPPTQ